MTNKVKRVSSQKSSAYRNYIDSPTDENWVKYKTIRNKSNALNKLTMKKYWRDKLETGNNKEYHRTISKFLGWRNRSALPDNIDQEVCTSFNEFFINIGPSLSKNVKVESTPKLPMFEKTIVLKKTEPKEVLEIINNLASKNSSGIDGISSIMLKNLALTNVLRNVFSQMTLRSPESFPCLKREIIMTSVTTDLFLYCQ